MKHFLELVKHWKYVVQATGGAQSIVVAGVLKG